MSTNLLISGRKFTTTLYFILICAVIIQSTNQSFILYYRNKKRFHHQALIEVRILDHLRKKDQDCSHNVIHMLEYFYFRNHLCISFELMK